MPTPVLTRLDRCDRCGARAYTLVAVGKHEPLKFCVHHFTQHEDVLREHKILLDQREQLQEDIRV